MSQLQSAAFPSLVVLTGFMGTGKSASGRLVANKLGWAFVDMDSAIEAEEGMTVAAIFETRGEPYFRAREADWCERLASRDHLVVATGGGALIDPANRARFLDAFVVCLDAEPEELYERLKGQTNRPLIASADPRRRIDELLAARRDAYAQIKYHVDTTGKSAQQVAEEILRLFAPR